LAVVAEAEALVVVLQVVVLEAVASVEDLEVEDSLAADLVEAGKIFNKTLHLEKRVLIITTKSRLASGFSIILSNISIGTPEIPVVSNFIFKVTFVGFFYILWHIGKTQTGVLVLATACNI
jgi:hypothetical protein